MKRYDQGMLQTKTATQLVILIKDLDKLLFSMDKHLKKFDEDHCYAKQSLHLEVKSLMKLHHKSLNSLKGFKGRIHSEQIKYMFSEVQRDKYKQPYIRRTTNSNS